MTNGDTVYMYIHMNSQDHMDRLPLLLSDASGVPFYRQIEDQTAQLIRSGRLRPGTRLPSVRDLAKQLLVSLITVRRSYADLEGAGLIVRRQGRGTFVADGIEEASREQALREARKILAEALAGAARLGLGGEELRRCIEEILDRIGEENGSE